MKDIKVYLSIDNELKYWFGGQELVYRLKLLQNIVRYVVNIDNSKWDYYY